MMFPGILYSLWGSSRQAAIGPQSVPCLLLGTAISGSCHCTIYCVCSRHSDAHGWMPSSRSSCPALSDDPGQRIGYAVVVTMLVGLLLLAVGILRLGFVVNFISRPVLAGFASGSAIFTIISMLKVRASSCPLLFEVASQTFMSFLVVVAVVVLVLADCRPRCWHGCRTGFVWLR
jgi:SulP family sulfate permease